MVLDCHIHIVSEVYPQDRFAGQLATAGVDGGVVFSFSPPAFGNRSATPGEAKKRLDQVMEFTKDRPNLYPFFFIDPTEEGAMEQVDMAVEAGIRGFKVICSRHYPQDDRAMPVYALIAKKGKPILFHSGILYNDGPSCEYNRPGNFEHLFYIENLRFALAHISWPWCDELISVFGKWNHLQGGRSHRMSAQMYVDLTPGTPIIYRREALTKLLTVGYSMMEDRMIFGSDGSSAYDGDHIAKMIRRDNAIYDELRISDTVREKIFSGNVLRFIS